MQPQKVTYDLDLLAALQKLSESLEEAHEEGFPLPTKLAIDNAEKLLVDLYQITPQLFSVYPTDDGEIAIHVAGGYRRSVLFLCESGGEVLCLVNLSGKFRRKRYSDATTLPDKFVQAAIIEISA